MRRGLRLMNMAGKRIAALENTICRKLDGAKADYEASNIDRIPQRKKVTGRRVYCGTKTPTPNWSRI